MSHICDNVLCGVYARCAKVVGSEHYEHLLWFSGRNGLDIIQSLVGDSARNSAVHYIVVAKGFPPFVHIGNAVTNEYNLFLVYGQHLEGVVPVIAERLVCKCKNCNQQPAKQ